LALLVKQGEIKTQFLIKMPRKKDNDDGKKKKKERIKVGYLG
jgi:hypothetical protein